MFIKKKHLRTLMAAICLEAAVYALIITPHGSFWEVLFLPFMVPGLILQFFVGGGMSMIDGVSPGWRTDLAFALGFMLNTIVTYGSCLLGSKIVREVRPIFRTPMQTKKEESP